MSRRGLPINEFNPISNYEEKTQVEGFTLWELERPTWRVIEYDADDKSKKDEKNVVVAPSPPSININARDLSEFKCPICMEFMRETWTVMECMHRFCSECIQKCLRGGKQECPSCRQHVPSRRSLRRDHQMDALIRKIFPKLDRHERLSAKQEKEFNKVKAAVTSQELQERIVKQDIAAKQSRSVRNGSGSNSSSSNSNNYTRNRNNHSTNRSRTSSSSISFRSSNPVNAHDVEQQQYPIPAASRKRSRKQKSRHKSKRRRRSRSSSSQRVALSPPLAEDRDVRFQLTNDPESDCTPALSYPFLTTNATICVKHLKKYLQKKLFTATGKNIIQNVDHDVDVFVLLGKPGNITKIALSDDTRFTDIQAVCPGKKTTVLYYTTVPTNTMFTGMTGIQTSKPLSM